VHGESERILLNRQRTDSKPLFDQILEESPCCASSALPTDQVSDSREIPALHCSMDTNVPVRPRTEKVTAFVDANVIASYLAGEKAPAHLFNDGYRDRVQFARIVGRHEGATSALTLYEVEEATYKDLATSKKGMAHADVYRIAAARATVAQTRITTEYFNIEVLDLTSATVDAQLRTLELQLQGIRAADALHVATVSRWQANLILSTDDSILALDDLLRNEAGDRMRCYDSHEALRVL